MADNSDYKKTRTNLLDYLPEVYKSDTNRSIFENLFNRFLTKNETDKVKGYIGQGNPNAIIKRQIHEHNVHRQGYQLQPILHNKIGSEEYISSWYDLLNEAERQGIDREQMSEWLNLEKFNWVPPIDLDKFINYRDYYWNDEGNNNSRPQYFTIRNRCAVAESLVKFHKDLIDEFGGSIPTFGVAPVSNPTPPARILSVDSSAGIIQVEGDISENIRVGQYFEITGSRFNNTVAKITDNPVFDPITSTSTVTVSVSDLTSDEVADTTIVKFNFRQFDKLTVRGEYARLFTPGFIFMYRDSTNPELNNAYWTVIDSRLVEGESVTEIQIDTVFTNSTVDGVISQEETLINATVARDCQCSESIGWDTMQWDDNPLKPIWDNYNADPDVYDHASLVQSLITPNNTEPGTGDVDLQEFWWDTDNDQLKSYVATNEWKVIWNKFSTIIESSIGTAYWDYIPGCGVKSVTSSADQWIDQNKWIHKHDVDNVSTAKQAEMPIIEYSWDLELNEWTHTSYNWKYRALNTGIFESTDAKPYRIELEPLSVPHVESPTTENANTIIFDESYGDMTDFFVPGREFMVINFGEVFVVEQAYFRSSAVGAPHRTEVIVDLPINGMIPVNSSVRPTKTSLDEPWKGYNIHWLFDGIDKTVSVNHQPYNQLAVIPLNSLTHPHSSNQYTMKFTHYAQEVDVLLSPDNNFDGVSIVELYGNLQDGSTRTLQERAVKGLNQVRVYVNNIRQYGSYYELNQVELNNQISFTPEFAVGSPLDSVYVAGIQFKSWYTLNKYDVVRIEVGEAATADIGRGVVPVRTIESNLDFFAALAIEGQIGDTTISLIEYNKVEQVKTDVNQYPLFDIYNLDGTTANIANHIFGYYSTTTSPVYGNIGTRVETKDDSTDYMFEQLLLDDNGGMYAYRDYSEQYRDFWVNPATEEVKFWDGYTWTDKLYIGEYYIGAHVGESTPPAPYNTLTGMYWYDTSAQVLKRYNGTNWNVTYMVENKLDDETLVTIWRRGLHGERYEPKKRDWDLRSEDEYVAQRDPYIEQNAQELYFAATGSKTKEQASQEAWNKWHDSQANHLSPTGKWIGDWEIPDPLYFNHNHENRQIVSFRELFTHFASIIRSQPRIPGFLGPIETMFRMIPLNDINYGVGGTIREYNYSFDTFLSAMFINELTPRALFDFARDQYSILLNELRDAYRHRAVELLTNTTPEAFANTTKYVVDRVLLDHETNTSLSALYHDSTTYDSDTKSGLKNWIATLPYIGLASKMLPSMISDPDRGINEVVHHDSHRANYILANSVTRSISYTIVNKEDTRGRYQNPQNLTEMLFDKVGRVSDILPPNNFNEFGIYFNTDIINREGTYWLYVELNQSGNIIKETLYRLNVVSIGELTPSSTHPDGTLWYDMKNNQEVLRQKQTIDGEVEWVKVEGLVLGNSELRLHNGTDPNDLRTATVSCWQEVSFEEHLRSIVLEAENRLYEHAPENFAPKYDFDELKEQQPVQYEEKLLDMFTDYLKENEILNAYANSEYSSTDPFTWNYKYSAPGDSYEILSVDTETSAFVVPGNATTTFVGGSVFRIKNSINNQGTWTVSQASGSVYTGNTTTIYVDEDVADGSDGTIYTGQLPSSINTGSESGGYWKDLYEKMYNTPYPHLEPWKLQGYNEKPTWWDEEYLNDNINQWGDRRWKYKHGLEITDVDTGANTFTIKGNFSKYFTDTPIFTVDKSDPSIHGGEWNTRILDNVISVDPIINSFEVSGDRTSMYNTGHQITLLDALGNNLGQFTVQVTTYTGPPSENTIIYVEEDISLIRADIADINGVIYNPFSNDTVIHIDLGYSSGKNDIVVSEVEGRITKKIGMWRNIARGRIPAGRTYPDGTVSVTGNPAEDAVPSLPIWRYFSVNIGNVNTLDGYKPDAVFPPYWNRSTQFPVIPGDPAGDDFYISSIMSNFTREISFPSLNFAYGDMGPVEWYWRHSHDFMYGKLAIAFQLDPVRTLAATFGVDFYNLGGLLINKKTNNTLSHTTTTFHGDIVDGAVDKYNGINQWYVNYIRSSGFDASSSDFRDNWTQWTAPLTYQFASFVDTPSLDLVHRFVSLTEFDYEVTSKKSAGVEDYLIEGLTLYTTKTPPKMISVDNDSDWEFQLTTPSSNTAIEYYDIRNYPFYADPETNSCMIYTWPIEDVNIFNNTVVVPGNQTDYITAGTSLSIEGTGDFSDPYSPVWNNDNNVYCDEYYTVISSSHNVVTDQTVIELNESKMLTSTSATGLLRLQSRTLGWEVGQKVILSSSGFFPSPLQGDTGGYIYEYFIIPGTKVDRAHLDCDGTYVPQRTITDNTRFQLALTLFDAKTGDNIEINSTGKGTHFVGQLQSTFRAPNSSKVWKRYVLDKATTVSRKPPFTLHGIQTVINLVDGYKAKIEEDGWVINGNSQLKDPMSGSNLSYETELQHFINFNMEIRGSSNTVSEKYSATADVDTNVFTFDSAGKSTQLITGDIVNMYSDNKLFPIPFSASSRYYMIRDTIDTFRLAATKAEAHNGNAIDILDLNGAQALYISPAAKSYRNAHKTEINPIRNGAWFRPDRGIVSNVINGPTTDLYNTQLMLDQYGRSIPTKFINIFREDKETMITVSDGIPNDIELTNLFNDPYNYIHMSSLRVFIDTYEHVLKFNNRNATGQLIYDPFLGLNVTKFEMLFNRQPEFTQRPNVGGQYLHTYHNQGSELNRNIESSIEDLRLSYDTFQTFESNLFTSVSRQTMGYTGKKRYLDNLNTNEKSQFLFWRGQIQHKGSMNSVNAFVRSRRFIDAKVDEFWAVKVADFGSVGEKEYISMWISTSDTRSNEIRWDFVEPEDICFAGYSSNVYDDECGFAYPLSGQITKNPSFNAITLNNKERWYDQPTQLKRLRDNGGALHFDLKPITKHTITIADIDGIQDVNAFEMDVLMNVAPKETQNVLYRDNSTLEDPTYSYYTLEWNPDTSGSPIAQVISTENGNVIDDQLYIRHNDKADYVTVTLDWIPPQLSTNDNEGIQIGDDNIIESGSPTSTELVYTIQTPYKFLVLADSVRVFKNGTQLTNGVDYIELIEHNDPLDQTTPVSMVTDKIWFTEGFNRDEDTIRVVYKTSKLKEGFHYDIVNSDIIKLNDMLIVNQMEDNDDDIFVGSPLVNVTLKPMNLTIWTWSVDNNKHNPAKIIDTKSEAVIAPVQIWDPARGLHYYNASPVIDIQSPVNPAMFSNTQLGGVDEQLGMKDVHRSYTDLFPSEWNQTEVGKTWLDTSMMYYKPYYDSTRYTIDERTERWGKLADYGSLRLYTWIESDIPPSKYDTAASAEEGDVTIHESIRKTGRARKTLFELNYDNEWGRFVPYVQLFDVSIEGDGNTSQVFELRSDAIAKCSISEIDTDANTITTERDYSQRIVPTMVLDTELTLVPVWNRMDYPITEVNSGSPETYELDEPVVTEVDASLIPGSIPPAASYTEFTQFTVDSTEGNVITVIESINDTLPAEQEFVDEVILDSITLQPVTQVAYTLSYRIEGVSTAFTPPVNVYVNGTIKTISVIPVNNTVTVNALRINDRVQVVRPSPSQTVIDAEVEAGNMIHNYEFTEHVAYTDLGVEENRYYFWVENKSTKGKKRMSPKEAQTSLVNMPAPYVFFNNVKPEQTVIFGDSKVNLPNRFTQTVIRNVRDLVKSDNRYIVRWTRDETLRDSLEHGGSELQLKNLHEEWALIRRSQLSHIDRWMWDKVTESIVGYKLSDPTVRVPAIEYELYDTETGSETQYGFGDGQTFTHGGLALATVLGYLNDQTRDFKHIDINTFFNDNDFDTNENIVKSMNVIYNTFGHADVNNIFFECLLDALSVKRKYEGIFKTSMIALHGVRPFQVGGMFDD